MELKQEQQGVLFDQRFLETLAGPYILKSPRTAIVELIANAWDAGATKVKVSWPNKELGKRFSISDNGSGMTDAEINRRWRTLAYDRLKEQGEVAQFPDNKARPPRPVFGRNGVGRFAGFCFADEYFVRTSKNGKRVTYRIRKGIDQPIHLDKVDEHSKAKAGTTVYVNADSSTMLDAEEARAEIGMRFLTDPDFQVFVNGKKVDFSHVPKDNIEVFDVLVPAIGTVNITAIDTGEADKTTKQHGVAWHVHGRLVGECGWKGHGLDEFVDGRRIAAKRYTFIVQADCIPPEAIDKDWHAFDSDNSKYQAVSKSVAKEIKNYMLNVSKEDRTQTFHRVRKATQPILNQVGLRAAEKWKEFVQITQEQCPSINEKDLTTLSGVLAKLELEKSRYGLLQKLGELQPGQYDDLHNILSDWTLDLAKEVLDELKTRMKLLAELKRKIDDKSTQEVQELQPIFKQGLWIFGPEFETIEYTANEGMTKVIQTLFGVEIKGSLNRPDFAVLPDSSVGLYSYPQYDEYGSELGPDRLLIIELKKPGISISTEQKDQCWKYIKELYAKGVLQSYTKITCFPLGDSVDPQEIAARVERDGSVRIQPLNYGVVIERAKGRLLKLYDRVRNAPFLTDGTIDEYLKKHEEQASLFEAPAI